MIRNALEVFFVFLRLGCTSFGGPIAHLGYFHDEFVIRRKWFDDSSFADLVALCQFLPGPASSQVGIAIGLSRAGLVGAFLAWVGFTLPSAALMVAFAFGLSIYRNAVGVGWLHGLKVVAVAIVAQALWAMGTKLCPDRKRASVAALAAIGAAMFPSALGQIGVIGLGAILGLIFIREANELPHVPMQVKLKPSTGIFSVALFVALLISLPILAGQTGSQSIEIFNRFFRAGSLVFGGGHVVLPLLKAQVVDSGWVSADAFMAGYGAVQAVPGPLFSFSAYLGAISNVSPAGVIGAVLCLVGAFVPSFLLVFGALPFWEKLRRLKKMRSAMLGINAAVVGLLLAAFYNPVWISAIFSARDFVLALACFVLLVFWRAPSWGVVVIGASFGALFGAL